MAVSVSPVRSRAKAARSHGSRWRRLSARYDAERRWRSPTKAPPASISGELARVADEHDLRVGLSGVVEETEDLAGTDHGGFVDNDHGVRGEASAFRSVEVDEESIDGAGRNVGVGLELTRRFGGEGASDHRVA